KTGRTFADLDEIRVGVVSNIHVHLRAECMPGSLSFRFDLSRDPGDFASFPHLLVCNWYVRGAEVDLRISRARSIKE
ncbi:MAG: hypothetical protein LWX02_12955, partial [Deltaproteobacteria bacterium]|nr:hypothetical protein [Deltaproteobacteria bacterium]